MHLQFATRVNASKDNNMFTTSTMTVDIVNKAAWGALQECRKRDYSVAVAIVDRCGNVQVPLRDLHAGPYTPEAATRKAWTANSFCQSTAELAGLLVEKRIPSQVVNSSATLLVGGGLMGSAGDESVGGNGVSGALPGKSERKSIDGYCTEAGIAAIQDILEFGK